MAERTNVIERLGQWTLLAACWWLDEFRRGNPAAGDVAVSVNVSPSQLVGDRLLPDVVEAVERTGIPPHLLCLEITESVLLADRDAALAVLKPLQALGVRMAVDDFGAGFSSLAALSWIPVDIIKLDRSFSEGLQNFGRGRSVARAAIALGRELGLSVVAEGVETRHQWDQFRELGCDEAQGFLIGRPGPTLRVGPPGWIPQEASVRSAQQ
jgi:EAL domain-containing protein (putative c-di-GMP-specific phosphodiesterase class I)